MTSKEDRINTITQLLKQSLLPELHKDYGEFHLESKHFDEFRKNLDINLIALFDFIQQAEDVLNQIENKTLELRSYFILLLCEQTASGTLYQTSNKELLKHLNLLIEKHFVKVLCNDPKVLNSVYDYYKNVLNAKSWKKNLGAIHGFVEFCEIFYIDNLQNLDSNSATFLLSVGLLFRDFYDPQYKELGYKIFNIILKQTPKDVITEINIHNVIFNAVFEDLRKVDTEAGIRYILKCITNCLKYFKISNINQWTKLDDVIQQIIYRIGLAPSAQICLILLIFLSKIVLQITFDNNEQFVNEDNFNLTEEMCNKIQEYHFKTPHIAYRWAKRILQLIISESNYFISNTKISYSMLQAMYLLYLVYVNSIPVNLTDVHLIEFFKKIPLILIQAQRENLNDLAFVKVIKNWFQIFCKQCENNDSSSLQNFFGIFNKVCKL